MTQASHKIPASNAFQTQLRSIRSNHPGNLMARHLDETYVEQLDPTARLRLWKIIKSGFENPDSYMGAYAQNCNDYEEFGTLLKPMIRDYHCIPPRQIITQHHDWSSAYSKYRLQDIDPVLGDVSMRVRVGRNIAALPLPAAMSKIERVEFELEMIKAFTVLMLDPDFGGTYLSITPGSSHAISAEEYSSRVDKHQIFRDMRQDRYLVSAGLASDWPYGRGIYISGLSDFMIWVGEEDHLRIMSMRKGGDLSGLFARLHQGLEKLDEILSAFAHSAQYGFLTSCPTNLGTAMRASLHLALLPPTALLDHKHNILGDMKKTASSLGLAIRGSAGEHTGAGQNGIVDISPSARLGVSESEVLQCLFNGTAALWKLRKELTAN